MATSKKIAAVPANLEPYIPQLCDAMAKKFTDPATGTPFFQFKVEGGQLVAEGDAWGQKASVRPAHGTMQVYAEGYIQAHLDLEDANALRMPGFSS